MVWRHWHRRRVIRRLVCDVRRHPRQAAWNTAGRRRFFRGCCCPSTLEPAQVAPDVRSLARGRHTDGPEARLSIVATERRASVMEHVAKIGTGFRWRPGMINITAPAGRMMMQMIGGFAEFERHDPRACVRRRGGGTDRRPRRKTSPQAGRRQAAGGRRSAMTNRQCAIEMATGVSRQFRVSCRGLAEPLVNRAQSPATVARDASRSVRPGLAASARGR